MYVIAVIGAAFPWRCSFN